MTRQPTTAARAARRGGATVPEVALLMSFFLLFLFGVLEYSRYMLALHVATNAARDGARYAVVNVDKNTDFDYRSQSVGTGPEARVYPSVWQYTVERMGGVDRMIRNLTVSTFPCDPSKLFPTTAPYQPVVAAKTGYVAPTTANYPTGPAVTRTVSWNQAAFTERIAVQVKGTYDPVLPGFLFMSGTATFDIVMLAGSEG